MRFLRGLQILVAIGGLRACGISRRRNSGKGLKSRSREQLASSPATPCQTDSPVGICDHMKTLLRISGAGAKSLPRWHAFAVGGGTRRSADLRRSAYAVLAQRFQHWALVSSSTSDFAVRIAGPLFALPAPTPAPVES